LRLDDVLAGMNRQLARTEAGPDKHGCCVLYVCMEKHEGLGRGRHWQVRGDEWAVNLPALKLRS